MSYFQNTVFAQENLEVDRQAESFFCTCGCGILLSVCETQMICDVAGNMKDQIRYMIIQDNTEDEIKDNLVAIYGNSVFSIPPVEGFALTLWYYPIVGVIVGVVIIVLISRKRSNNINWRIDPDDVLVLNEEELLKQIDIDNAQTETSSNKYEDMLKKKLKNSKN
ncbi:cytochrome c-type biogenesis protein CcmH [Thermoproteota archaeon]